MKESIAVFAFVLFVCPAVWSGVVIEMEVTGAESGGAAPVDKIFAQGEMLRMDPHPKSGDGDMSVIFRDNALWFVDHEEKSCKTIDEEGMQRLTAEVDAAMQQMEAQMAQMPPEQREMMMKMMKQRMPALVGGESPPRRIEAGATEKVGEYSCKVHTLYVGDEKSWELCVATKGLPDGTAEAMKAFEAMSRFAEELRQIAARGPFAGMLKTPLLDMQEVEGFPVRVRSFDNGEVSSETTLKSVVSEELEASVFAAPEGYKVAPVSIQRKQGLR
jgi:hypothetical protein